MAKRDVQWNGQLIKHDGDTYIRSLDLALLAARLKAAGYSDETVRVVSWIAKAGD